MVIYNQIIPALLPPTPALARDTEKTIAAFVASTIRLAPWHLRFGVRCAELALLCWLILTARGFVMGQPDKDSLRRALEKFENLAGVTATLMRLYRSLALLAWFERSA